MSNEASVDLDNPSFTHDIEQKQDELLEKLDQLNANILALTQEFTLRLRSETSGDAA